MSSQGRLAKTRSSRQRAIQFVDPFNKRAPPIAKPTNPAPAPILVRRGNSTSSFRRLQPRPKPPTETIDVQARPLMGRAPPAAQFDMVTPPRSPTDTSIERKPSRLPLRSASGTPAKHRLTPPTPSRQNSQNPNASLIPVRKSVPDWTESHRSFAEVKLRERRTLPLGWFSGVDPRPGEMQRRDTMPTMHSEPVLEHERRRAQSDPAVDVGMPLYPQLTSSERNVLVQKLRVLLKCIDVDSQALDNWETAPTKAIPSESDGRVFGTCVKTSIVYASCKVVLGEHSHHLPICVFASVEEICRRGTTTPALFRLAPSLNERTLEQLSHTYDQRPTYGAGHSLAAEDIANVCALLKLYLRGLPEPVFASGLWELVNAVTRGTFALDARIAAVQAAFHLQHPTSFSLLVYVFAFLHELLQHGAQNGLTVPTLAGMFGAALFSPRKAGELGVVLSPKPDVPVLVKTFRSEADKQCGVRVMEWILERWAQVAAGLLSVDVVRDGEDWEAKFAEGGLGEECDTSGSESETVCSEGTTVDKQMDTGLEKLGVFPEVVSVEQVRVRHVKDSIVEVPGMQRAQSTRPSSPETIWSQESAPQKSPMRAECEPEYVRDLRRRMCAQEAELVALWRVLDTIRDRLVFPLPPDEDTMPTPRARCGPTMGDLVESLESEPPTPLFHRALRAGMGSAEEIIGPDMFSDTSSSSDEESLSQSLFVANPDYKSERGGKLEELYTARDALRSALAAMAPVEMQLRAVEKELQEREAKGVCV